MLPIVPSLIQLLLISVLSVFLSLTFKFIIKPLIQLQYYKNKRGVVIFHWQIIPYIKNYYNTFTQGHFYHQYIEAFRKNPQAKFIAENFGSRVNVILTDPSLVKQFLMRHEVYQRDWQNLDLLRDLIVDSGGFSKGNKYKRARRLISATFNFESIKEKIPLMVETTQEIFKSWIIEGKLNDLDLVENFAHITGEITGRVIFGTKFNEFKIEGESMSSAVQKLVTIFYQEFFSPSLLSIIFGPRFYKTNILARHRKINKMIAELRAQAISMIKEIEKSGKREKNLLWTLLDDRDVDKDSLNDEQILGEFIGLFTAGTETTSHLISSALYFLWKDPKVFAKVKEEVDEVFREDRPLELGTLSQMEYTTCLLKETLRLGGPIATLHPRTPIQDDDLDGLVIKKGSLVNYYHNVFFMSEKYYTNPNEFMPERWLPNSTNQDGSRNEPYSFIPFSAGPRNCLGQHMAQIEAKIILGLFIKTFDFKFPEGYEMIMIQKGTYQPLDSPIVNLQPKINI